MIIMLLLSTHLQSLFLIIIVISYALVIKIREGRCEKIASSTTSKWIQLLDGKQQKKFFFLVARTFRSKGPPPRA